MLLTVLPSLLRRAEGLLVLLVLLRQFGGWNGRKSVHRRAQSVGYPTSASPLALPSTSDAAKQARRLGLLLLDEVHGDHLLLEEVECAGPMHDEGRSAKVARVNASDVMSRPDVLRLPHPQYPHNHLCRSRISILILLLLPLAYRAQVPLLIHGLAPRHAFRGCRGRELLIRQADTLFHQLVR